MTTLSFDLNPDESKPQQQTFRATDSAVDTSHLTSPQGNYDPATLAQTNINSSAISLPQGIRSKWANADQKSATEKVVPPKKNSSRNRWMFVIALLTIAPILAVVSAVLSDARFSDVLQNPLKQALFLRMVGRASQGFPPAAMMLYEQAHNLNPVEPGFLTDIGLLKIQTGDNAGAKAAFQASVKIAPTARAYNDLGICFFAEGNYQEAISNYNSALALDKGWAMAWNNRGLAFAKLRQYEQSISDYSQAIKLRYATSYFGRSETYAAMGQGALAARDERIIRRHGYTNTAFCFMAADPPPDEQ
jgi:tetratricopeptide (TPR) repeat protein